MDPSNHLRFVRDRWRVPLQSCKELPNAIQIRLHCKSAPSSPRGRGCRAAKFSHPFLPLPSRSVFGRRLLISPSMDFLAFRIAPSRSRARPVRGPCSRLTDQRQPFVEIVLTAAYSTPRYSMPNLRRYQPTQLLTGDGVSEMNQATGRNKGLAR